MNIFGCAITFYIVQSWGCYSIKKIMKMSQQAEAARSVFKRQNELFQSRYFAHSQKKIDNPETVHNFFHDHPFEKFYQDIATLKPVSYSYPYPRILDRSFVVVDEKFTYGKPLTPEELEEMRAKRRQEPEVVTWGKGKGLNIRLKVSESDTGEIEKEVQRGGWWWCCAPTAYEKDDILLQNV